MDSVRASLVPQGKESVCLHRRCGFDPWVRRSPGEGNDYPPQYSYLENPMDRGAWRSTVHGVAKSRTKELVTEQQHKFSKLGGHKISTEKSAAFPHTNNERAEGETQEMIPFTTASNRRKYFRKKPTWGGRSPLLWKLRCWWKKSKPTHRWKEWLVLGGKESTLKKKKSPLRH